MDLTKIKNERVLKLTLKKKWFDMILSGEKTEEYRDIKPYFESRLIDKNEQMRSESPSLGEYYPSDFIAWKDFDFVLFTNGYSKNSRIMLVELKGMGIAKGNPKWGAEKDKDYYVISLGDVKSCDQLSNDSRIITATKAVEKFKKSVDNLNKLTK